MAEERDIWIEFVGKLKELTESDKLRWHSVRPTEVPQRDPNRKVSMVFEAKYKDRTLRLYEENHNLERLPVSDALARLLGREHTSWQVYIVLELVDENEAAWEFPNIEGLEDLLESVKYQVTRVNEYIEAVLADGTAKSR